jgi:hypothetical protein
MSLAYRRSHPAERRVRAAIINWCREEMRVSIRPLATLIAEQPRRDQQPAGDKARAGALFTLPSEPFPESPLERWRAQERLRALSKSLAERIRQRPGLGVRVRTRLNQIDAHDDACAQTIREQIQSLGG